MRRKFLTGFMMIELLISVLIMSMMSSIVLSANSSMSARLQTDNLAHIIALSVREAQTRALSAVAPVGADTASEVPGYGIYMNLLTNSTMLFSDTQLNNAYVYSESVPVEQKVLGQGYAVSNIEVEGGSPQPVTGLSIYFKRPRPDALIRFGTGPGGAVAPTIATTQATITLRAPKSGVTKTIIVTSTGQISVQ